MIKIIIQKEIVSVRILGPLFETIGVEWLIFVSLKKNVTSFPLNFFNGVF